MVATYPMILSLSLKLIPRYFSYRDKRLGNDLIVVHVLEDSFSPGIQHGEMLEGSSRGLEWNFFLIWYWILIPPLALHFRISAIPLSCISGSFLIIAFFPFDITFSFHHNLLHQSSDFLPRIHWSAQPWGHSRKIQRTSLDLGWRPWWYPH